MINCHMFDYLKKNKSKSQKSIIKLTIEIFAFSLKGNLIDYLIVIDQIFFGLFDKANKKNEKLTKKLIKSHLSNMSNNFFWYIAPFDFTFFSMFKFSLAIIILK